MITQKKLLKKSVFRRTENGNIPTEQCLYYTVYTYNYNRICLFGYQCSLGKSNIDIDHDSMHDLIISMEDEKRYPTIFISRNNRTVKRVFIV